MHIKNGKWVDQYDDPVTVFNFNELKEISQKVKAVYGKNITYNRIELISSIKDLSEQKLRVGGLIFAIIGFIIIAYIKKF